jgi:uncharacterized protein (DUF1330 family)
MAVYMVAAIRVTDAAGYPEYARLAGPAVEQYGGRYLVRGGAMETLEGSIDANRLVVIEFPSREQATKWWTSPEYEAAKLIRRAVSTGDFALVEGYNG